MDDRKMPRTELIEELERLRAENARLRAENARLLEREAQLEEVEDELQSALIDLSRHREELAAHRNKLEQTVVERTDELTRKNEVLETVFDHIPVMLCFYRDDGRIVLVNAAFERMADRSAEALTDRPVTDALGLGADPAGDWFFQDQPVSQWRDIRIQTPDRAEMETSWAKIRLSDGTFIGIGIDISQRKKSEEALKWSEQNYRDLVEKASSVIIRLDTDGRITFFNEFAQQLFGFSETEIKGRSPLGYILPDTEYDAEDIDRVIRAVRNDPGREVVLEVENVGRDLRRIWIRWAVKAMVDRQNQLIGILAVGQDVTERKKYDEQLKLYQNRLVSLASELSVARERERRNIAVDLHDGVAQSLTLSKMKLVTAVKSGQLGQPAAETVTLKDARSLILALRPPVLYEVGLSAAIEELLEEIGDEYDLETAFRNQGLSEDMDEDVRSAAFRAVRELILNVVKHADASRVAVRIDQPEKTEFRVAVIDDGRGFDPWMASDPPGPKKTFGLFGIREQIRYMGGNLTVDSAPGQGARAVLTIPLRLP
jgi:PAS domain S-box-containing protein